MITSDQKKISPLGIGFHREIPADVYHALPYCSNSRLSTLHERSAKHVRYEMDNPEDPTESMIIGNALHVATLQPHLFAPQYVRADRCHAQKKDGVRCNNPGRALVAGEWLCGVHIKADRHEKAMKAAVEQALDQGFVITNVSDFQSHYFTHPDGRKLRIANHAPGAIGLKRMVADGMESIRVDLPPYGCDDPRIVLAPEQHDKVMAMRDSILNDEHASKILSAAEDRELSAVWALQNGLICKGRFDAMDAKGGALVDLKTTDDASAAFERKLDDFGYARQSAMYTWGCAALGVTIERFVFLAVEKNPPYAVGVHTLSEASMDLAADELNPLLDGYRECEMTGRWPGYRPRIAGLPAWAQTRINKAAEAAGVAS